MSKKVGTRVPIEPGDFVYDRVTGERGIALRSVSRSLKGDTVYAEHWKVRERSGKTLTIPEDALAAGTPPLLLLTPGQRDFLPFAVSGSLAFLFLAAFVLYQAVRA